MAIILNSSTGETFTSRAALYQIHLI